MAVETNVASTVKTTADYFMENSKTGSNGIVEISKNAYKTVLEEQGVTQEDVKRVHDAQDFANTAAAEVALRTVEGKIGAATPEQLQDKDFRKNLSATVRVPTFGGTTEITHTAEKITPIPFRGEGEEPAYKTSYGTTSTKINAKGRIHKEFHAEADHRMRVALGLEPKTD